VWPAKVVIRGLLPASGERLADQQAVVRACVSPLYKTLGSMHVQRTNSLAITIFLSSSTLYGNPYMSIAY
jgi:hypothetical protein